MIKLKAVLGLIIFLGAICVRGEIVHVYEQAVAGGVTNRLSDTTKETGGDYVTQSAPSIAGFIFTGWTTDAKQPFDSRDVLGRSFDAAPYHLYESMTLTANYLEESIDSDGDGIADGSELYWYGDLSKDAASDTDGDGYGFAAELAAGTNPLMKDRTIIGGVEYEDSDELLYNPHRYAPLTIRSEPEGTLFATTVEYLVPGTAKAGQACDSRETSFAYWMTNGVPVRDALGRAVDSVTFEMPESAVELVAVCVEDEVERQKLYWYGTAEVSSDSDTDGDGYTLAQELAAGTNPLMKDRTIIGGVVYEDSEELEYNPNRYRKCVIRSEPEGVLFDSITSTVRAGDPITTTNCAGLDGFACWRVDGVDVRDSLGRAMDSVSILMPNHDSELVAVCVESDEERTKLYWYGTTDVSFDSDTDGDGYTFAQELAAGTNPLMKDRTVVGGVVYEDAVTLEVNLQPFERVRGFIVNGKFMTPELAGRAIWPVVVDVNGDGVWDVVICCEGGARVLVNVGGLGNPEFEERTVDLTAVDLAMNSTEKLAMMALDVAPVGALSATVWADVLLVSDAEGRIWYYKGTAVTAPVGEDADGTVSYALQHKVWGGSFAGFAQGLRIAAVDWDDDGDLDCLCGTAEGKLMLLRDPKGGRQPMVTNTITYIGVDGAANTNVTEFTKDDLPLVLGPMEREGWRFLGWTPNGGVIPSGTMTNVTFVSQWAANEYTVRFDANGGSGTMADEVMTYDSEKTLAVCAFTRTGYMFAGWTVGAPGGRALPDCASVKNLTDVDGGTVTLYAKWTPNNYVIDFNHGEGGEGTMSDQPMTYDEAAALYSNLFFRAGYTFLGWTDDENELEEVLFYDGVVVSNLTDEVDGEFDLYAVWAANEYTVRFNANGGEGTMSDQAFLYDAAQSLASNKFTRTGYTFAGWARNAATGMSPPQLDDGEAVSNLTATADGIVTLYAVWTANPYTIRFNANGGEGTMTDLGCVYGAERSLTANAFTRKGYAFAGWTTSEKGPVVYADGASVTSLTAEANGVVTLYAVWQAGANAVSFDGNGGTPSETSRSVLTDAQIGALPSATRTGWTLVGWFTAASGGTQVSADAVIAAAVTFFAQWTANAYSVKYDANGGSGTMADEPMTYDEEKTLTACAFTRRGYTFAGWATAADGAVKYADGATVKNLTATADGTVTLYAKWTPNNYVIDFNPGQGGTGTMSGQPMTYDEEEALYANLFARTGYTFLGWTDDEGELEEVLFYDGVVVSNLTDEVDGEYGLYAAWAANEYAVRFDANGGKGVMADQAFVYDTAQNLTSNGFARAGYEFLGWAMSAVGEVVHADGEAVSNLTAEADGVVNLYAVWDGTAKTWMEDESFSAAVANTYDGYVIDDECNLLGIVLVKTTKQSVKKGVATIAATATVTDASGKKWNYSKGVVTVDGVVTGLKCLTKGCPVAEFGVTLGQNGMEGAWGEYAIFGARNGMGTKGDAMMTALEAYKGKWSASLCTSGEDAASPLAVRLQLDVQAKGVVKIAGNWENGAKVSASAQLVMGNGFVYVPVIVKATKTSPALNALLRIDPNEAATGMSPPQAVTLLSGGELIAGGRTVDALGEPVYLPSEVSAGGKVFSARVALNELAYPVKFAAKKLPAGLKINASTGVVSGTPTKPGRYVAEVTVTSGLNSKVKKTLTVEFDIANYTDGLIPIEDAYGPYYVGVAAEENIAAAAGCSVSGLPSGLKWTAKDVFDSKTEELKTSANTVYGVPTKAGTSTVYFKKTMRETVDGKQKSVTRQASATFIVEGMKPWAVGTFNGGSTNGIVTLTVSNVGKISGKWMSEGLTWTLSAASYAAYYPDEEKYVATVVGKGGKETKTVVVEVTQECVVGLSAPVAEDRDGTVLFEAWRNGWKEEPLKTLATKLKGAKVSVAVPFAGDNDGTVELTVGASGAVTAKGTFVTGFDEKKQKDIVYSASCSSVLIPMGDGRYRTYVYIPPKVGKFSGLSRIVEMFWNGTMQAVSTHGDYGFVRILIN